MTKKGERAARFQRLRDDETFREAIAEVRSLAIARFADSAAAEAARREEAHALLRALAEIEGVIQAVVDDHAFEQKKGQHRGSD